RDGRDGVAWHADDETELGPEPVIASISLGATRRFQLRRRDDRTVRRELDLHDGDVVVMRGTTQALWLHQVPKTSRPVGERINLTFRSIVPAPLGSTAALAVRALRQDRIGAQLTQPLRADECAWLD